MIQVAVPCARMETTAATTCTVGFAMLKITHASAQRRRIRTSMPTGKTRRPATVAPYLQDFVKGAPPCPPEGRKNASCLLPPASCSSPPAGVRASPPAVPPRVSLLRRKCRPRCALHGYRGVPTAQPDCCGLVFCRECLPCHETRTLKCGHTGCNFLKLPAAAGTTTSKSTSNPPVACDAWTFSD